MAEFVNLLGLVSVTALACNFHGHLAQWISPWWRFDPDWLEFISFVLLLAGGVLLVHVILRRLAELIKWERVHWTIQGLGLFLGGIRGLWWSGLLLLIMLSVGVPYLSASIQERSVLGPNLVSVSKQGLGWVADRYPGHAGRVVLIPTVKLPVPKFPQPEKAP